MSFIAIASMLTIDAELHLESSILSEMAST